MNFKKLLLVVSATFILSACGEKEVFSVEYYAEHIQEANEKLNECGANLTLEKDQNCINARTAVKNQILGTGKKDYSKSFD